VVTLRTTKFYFKKSTFWLERVDFVLCGFKTNQRVFPYTALTNWIFFKFCWQCISL